MTCGRNKSGLSDPYRSNKLPAYVSCREERVGCAIRTVVRPLDKILPIAIRADHHKRSQWRELLFYTLYVPAPANEILTAVRS